MSEANTKAYIDLPTRTHVFEALDDCVQADLKKIAFLTSVSGAGRTALLETWAKQALRRRLTVSNIRHKALHRRLATWRKFVPVRYNSC